MQTSAITKFREDNDGMTLEAFGRLFTPAFDKSTVLRWEQGRLPIERALEIERVTGIPRHELRPDVFVNSQATEAAE